MCERREHCTEDEPGNKNPGLCSRQQCHVKHGAVSGRLLRGFADVTRGARRSRRSGSGCIRDGEARFFPSLSLSLSLSLSFSHDLPLPPSAIRWCDFCYARTSCTHQGKFPGSATIGREKGKWIFTAFTQQGTQCARRAGSKRSCLTIVLINTPSIAVAIPCGSEETSNFEYEFSFVFEFQFNPIRD